MSKTHEPHPLVEFHPCPHHFPNLWKVGTLTLPELTPEQIGAIRKIYQLPETSIITEAFAKSLLQRVHGFLVMDGRLVVEAGIIRSLQDLHRAATRFTERYQVPEACYKRAASFSLPEEWSGPGGQAAGLAEFSRGQRVCLPCARETWPPVR